MRRIAAQTRIELLLTLRRGESLLVVAGIPIGILVFFSMVDVLPHGRARVVDFLAPGVLALAVMSSAMTSLGIATGFERQAGVLRRLGTTPLGRGGLLAAKIVSTATLVAFQVALAVGVAFALRWRPHGSVAATAVVIGLGTAAFAGIGFTLAGRLRAETNLAVANALFLVFLLLGGIVVPLERLPDGVRAIAHLLPAAPFATALRQILEGGVFPGAEVITIGVWAVATALLAIASFRWD